MADIKKVAARDAAKQNSPVITQMEDEGTVVANKAMRCYWNGEGHDDGARVCDNGTVYECMMGKWLKTKMSC